MSDLLLLLRSGLPLGIAYGLIAYSFTLTYKSSGTFNFAVGQLAILAALVYISLSGVMPVVLAAVVGLVLLALLGAAVYFIVVRRPDVRGAAPVTLLILMLGVSMIIENTTPTIWGYYALEAPPLFAGGVALGSLYISFQQLAAVVLGLLSVGAVFLFERRTMLGKALIAAGSDREAAILSGVNDRMIQGLAWGLAFALTALAGLLVTPLTSARITSSANYSVLGISAAFIGGLGSGSGALLGGVIIGVGSALIAGYVSTQYADVIVFSLVVVVLLIRPAGILGDIRRFTGPRA